MILILPLRVALNDKKDFILNLNNYRNAYHYDLNKSKVAYSALVVAQLPPGNQLMAEISKAAAEAKKRLRSIEKDYKHNLEMVDSISDKVLVDFESVSRKMHERLKGLKTLKVSGKVVLRFTYYHGSKQRVDVSNPCSIIDKYACDALTAAGIWPDDDTQTVQRVIYQSGGVDKENPRCELEILKAM